MTSESTAGPHDLLGELEPGSRIAGYEIEEQIGSGGMAVVFRARDETLGRPAAIKVVAPALARDPEFRARFLRESRAAAAVDSPHIIPVYAAGEADGILYIAMRFAADGDAAALARRAGGFLAAERAARLVAQVASALDAAHAAGLVHRDVKPQNILIDSGPELPEHAFLSDFGVTKGTGPGSTAVTADGHFVGTPEFCAPEQIKGAAVDGRADQYALGCVAFALLTGESPFHRDATMATLFAHVYDPVPALTATRAELPAAVDAVMARALAKSPDDRYPGCGEFAAALQAALQSTVEPAGRQADGAEDAEDAFVVPASAPVAETAKDKIPAALAVARGPVPKRANRRAILAAAAVAAIAGAAVFFSTLRPARTSASPPGPLSQITGPAGAGAQPSGSAGAAPASGRPGASPLASVSPGSPGSSSSPGSSASPSAGSSKPAGQASVGGAGNPVVTPLPGQVTGLTATAGNGIVTLTWKVPSGSPTGYQVSVSPVPAGQSATQAVASVASATVADLTDGTTYTFTVLARNATGNGPASAAVTAVPVGPPIATSPPLVTNTGSTGAASIIEVSAETGYTANGSPAQGYTVYEYKASSSSGPWTEVTSQGQAAHGGNITVPRFTVANDGSWYEYAYTVTTAAGTSRQSPLSAPIQAPTTTTSSSTTASA